MLLAPPKSPNGKYYIVPTGIRPVLQKTRIEVRCLPTCTRTRTHMRAHMHTHTMIDIHIYKTFIYLFI